MNATNQTVEILDFWTCLFLDPPPEHWVALTPAATAATPIGESSNNLTSPYIYYECRAYGKYFFGVDPKTIFTNGHYIFVAIFLVTLLASCLGMVGNTLNVIVLQKSQKSSSLKDLLIILAIVEWIACCSTIAFSYLILSILGKTKVMRHKSKLHTMPK